MSDTRPKFCTVEEDSAFKTALMIYDRSLICAHEIDERDPAYPFAERALQTSTEALIAVLEAHSALCIVYGIKGYTAALEGKP